MLDAYSELENMRLADLGQGQIDVETAYVSAKPRNVLHVFMCVGRLCRTTTA